MIPIIDNKSEDKIRNELYFARKTSEAVMEGIVSHFLVYYGGYDCKNTIYKEDSKFNLVSQKYSLIKKVVSRMNKFDKKRVSRELEALSFDEVKDLYPDVEYNVESTVLFSQMLWGDVRTYLEKPRSEKEWNLIIDQIILCAKELEILDIGHNDLHLGNLLIKDINTLELVVHDYGRSSEGYNKDDFGGALDALTKSNPPLKVLNRINKISWHLKLLILNGYNSKMLYPERTFKR